MIFALLPLHSMIFALHSMIFALLSLAWLGEAAAGTQGLLLEVVRPPEEPPEEPPGCETSRRLCYLVRPQEGSEGQLGAVEHS